MFVLKLLLFLYVTVSDLTFQFATAFLVGNDPYSFNSVPSQEIRRRTSTARRQPVTKREQRELHLSSSSSLRSYHVPSRFTTSPSSFLKSTASGNDDSSSTAAAAASSGLLYQVQEQILIDRGEHESIIMQDHVRPLEAHKPKGVGRAGGFGGPASSSTLSSKQSSSSSSTKKKQKKNNNKVNQGLAYATVLQQDGVVRINSVLSKAAAQALRHWVVEHRRESLQLVNDGTIRSKDRFADVLLKHNRCDLTLPLGPKPVMNALYEVLCTSPLPDTLAAAWGSDKNGDDPVLYELSTLISDPGSQRQVVHPDNPILGDGPNNDDNNEPILLTCFVALQDVELDMGPTVWLPGTHTREAHAQFLAGDEAKDALLSSRPKVLGLLKQGDCAIYDSRVLHCGSANQSKNTQQSRALFYVSFRNPRVSYPGNPASIRPAIGASQFTLSQLQALLIDYRHNKGTTTIDLGL